MKPIKLKMKAFLGFQDETIIDFTKLYSDKIFLITGATGSGKTSIFDAITYALYGEGSGNERNKAKCYMSHLATEKDTMEVSLEFSVKGENYFVERFDSDFIPSRKKAKFYKEGEEADAITRLSDIPKEIENVIGLNAEQFKKIVMLPQGEFKEFLSSNTREKTEILKKLFATEVYENLQKTIKEKYDKEKLDNQTLIEKFKEALFEVGLQGEDIETGYESLKSLIKKEEEENTRINTLKEEFKENLDKAKIEKEKNIMFNKSLKDFIEVKNKYFTLKERKDDIENKEKNLKNIYKSKNILTFEKRINEEIETLGKTEKNLKEIKETIKDFNKIKKENEEKFIEYKKDYINLDAKKEKLRIFEEKKEKITTAKEMLSSLKISSERFKTLSEKLLNIKDMEKEKETLKEDIVKAKENTYKTLENKRETEKELSEKEKILEVLRNLFSFMQKIDKNKKEIRSIMDKNDILKGEKSLSEEKLLFEKEKRKGNYALVLKRDLKENEPCPVCGSKDHPGIDLENNEGFSSDLIDELESTISLKTKEINEAESSIKLLLYKNESIEEDIENLKKEYNIDFKSKDELSSIGIKFKEEREKLLQKEKEIIKKEEDNIYFMDKSDSKISTLNEKLEEKDFIEKQHEEKNKEIIELKQSIKSLKLLKEDLEKSKEIEESIKKLNSTIEKTSLNYDTGLEIKNEDIEKSSTLNTNKENLRSRVNDLNEKIITFKDSFKEKLQKEDLDISSYNLFKNEISKIEDLEKEINLYNKEINESFGSYNHMKKDFEGKKEVDLNEIEKKIIDLTKEFEEKEEESKRSDYNLRTYYKTEKKVKGFEKSYKDKREKLKILEDLYSTSSIGFTFETFVQSYHFEGILERANFRLSKMTKGRYSLRRRRDDDSRSKKTGLDIDIFDEYSGRERDVLSLSGGESFKASLALALGLSEFIESASGNVNLDTIFIDEGFGSLDEESLDSALECLLELNLSGRIVGIISHVAELKERIPKKIEVEAIPGKGSKMKIN